MTNKGAMWSDGDFNRDGKVDLVDLTTLGEHWQLPPHLPEPGALSIILIVGALLFSGRGHRHFK